MSSNRRVLIVGITLVVLVVVYMVFIAGGDSPRGMSKEDYSVPAPVEPTGPEGGGKVGDIGIETVKQTEYVQRDDQKNIQRVFGFEELLYQAGDNWQLSKPYMKIYEEDSEAIITADAGTVQMQVTGNNPVPRDARLSGNVQFHIVRKTAAGDEVSDIYLDDVVFVSDRSTFYTDGPVKLVSPQCRMEGRGVEVVYSAEMKKLLLFRMDQLDDMRFRMRTGESFFRQSGPRATIASGQAAAVPSGDQPAGQFYECLLDNNVTIEYAGHVVLADRITIRNILWTPGGRNDKTAPASAAQAAAAPAGERERFEEVRLVCDGGVVIKPATEAVEEFRVRTAGRKRRPSAALTPEELAQKNVFRAKSLDYDMLKGDGVAQGPLDVVFHADSVSDPNVASGRTIATISSSRYATYAGASNEIRFVGDVVARVTEPAAGWQQKSTVYADEAVARIRSIAGGEKAGLAAIEDVNCMGRIVRLETVRKSGDELLGGVNLKCLNLHYDGQSRLVTGTGPGVIAVDNSHVSAGAKGADDVSLSRRCYAAVDKFGSLQWFVDDGRILAHGADEGLRIAYWPVLENGYGSRIIADTQNVQGTFVRLPDGRTEIDELNAFGGVYVERGESQKIWGDRFLYRQNTGFLTVTGRPDKPCVYNGVKAPQFEMNVRTGSVKTKLSGGGVNR